MKTGRSAAKLSVNVNKVATLRNSRGGAIPGVVDATRVCVAAGAPGITVHPRADARHITFTDVREIAAELGRLRASDAAYEGVELNIEGDPRADLLALAEEVRPDQFTLVPVRAGEITSQAGWDPATPTGELRRIVSDLHRAGVRVSVFVDPDPDAVRWAASLGGDRIELYTEPFAKAFHTSPDAGRDSFAQYSRMATLAHELGLGVNAGHDLDLDNLTLFRHLPHLDEASIGHALISHALYVGLAQSVSDYIQALVSDTAPGR
jgi:pyridoxine 5-phosphate synthase